MAKWSGKLKAVYHALKIYPRFENFVAEKAYRSESWGGGREFLQIRQFRFF